jgi:hypothetical protein
MLYDQDTDCGRYADVERKLEIYDSKRQIDAGDSLAENGRDAVAKC